MKFVRYGGKGHEKPGLIDEQGQLRDLSGEIPDLAGDYLNPDNLKKITDKKTNDLPVVSGTPRLAAPITDVGKIIGIGLNYADHAKEANMEIPSEPLLFFKAVTSLAGPDDPFKLPPNSTKVDWEVELAIIIGKRAQHIGEHEVIDHIAGYAVINDISERAWQLENTGQWVKGKSYDGFAPLGPWLVTPDEIPDPGNLAIWLELNGARVQDGSTRTMVYGVKTLVSYISQYMTLMPGDVIATGTPPGVGLGMSPPQFLTPSDTMRLGIEGLGEQKQVVQ